jgi:ribonuclease P/MRP protein subunit POP7
MGIVKRARKQLDKSTRYAGPSTKRLSLAARIAAIQSEPSTGGSDAEVVVMGTGKAIKKTLDVASWFSNQQDCDVQIRTRTVATVDDIVLEEGGHFEDESRVRQLSCLEVTVTLK